MPAHVLQLHEISAIYVKYCGDVSVQDLKTSTDKVCRLMSRSEKPIHLICDFNHVGHMPIDAAATGRIFLPLMQGAALVIVDKQNMYVPAGSYSAKDFDGALQKIGELAYAAV